MIIQGVEYFNEYLLPQENRELENKTAKWNPGTHGQSWLCKSICVGGRKEGAHFGQDIMCAGLSEEGPWLIWGDERDGCSWITSRAWVVERCRECWFPCRALQPQPKTRRLQRSIWAKKQHMRSAFQKARSVSEEWSELHLSPPGQQQLKARRSCRPLWPLQQQERLRCIWGKLRMQRHQSTARLSLCAELGQSWHSGSWPGHRGFSREGGRWCQASAPCWEAHTLALSPIL